MLTTDLIPARDPASRRLMVVLHGLGDSMEGFRWMPAALKLPWMNFLLVNAPDDYYGGFSWYDFAGDPIPGIKRSRNLLFELLDRMRAENYPSGETIVAGFSQGCLMTLEVGLRYPHRLAGLVGISGYAHEPETLVAEASPHGLAQKFLITHGRHDTLVPFAAVKKQMEGLRQLGVGIDWREFDKAHTIAGEEELSVIRDFIYSCYPAHNSPVPT